MRDYAFRIVNVFAESAARPAIRCACSRTRAGSTTRRCRRSRCSSTCRRRRSSCRRHGATARVRIFTPTFEMPFAGHPTLGTAHVVRELAARRRRRDAGDEGRRHSGDRAGDVWTLRSERAAARARLARVARRHSRRCSGSPRAICGADAAVGRHRARAARDPARQRRRRAPRRAATRTLLQHARQQRPARDGVRLGVRRKRGPESRARAASSFRSTAR